MLGKLKKALKSLVKEVSSKVSTEEPIEQPKPVSEEGKETTVIAKRKDIGSKPKETVEKKGFFAKVKESIAYKEINLKKLEPIFEEYVLTLAEADVAYEVAEDLINDFKSRLAKLKIRRGESEEKVIENALRESLLSILSVESIDLVEIAKRYANENKVLKVMVMGVNGVGKTTTIAKIAYLLKKTGVTPVIAAADTFRAGAVEQLKVHAERIGVPIITRPYGTDPAAVAYDAIEFARARGFHVVLIDTAGRMHVDSDLMNELRKINRVVRPDLKILVLDALTGNDALEQARFFDEAVGIDAIILTKVDADAKGGAALSVIATLKKPVMYLGVGQSYDDLIRFDPKWLVERIMGSD
ncbi:signal recognition particle [Ignicoccus islandicus DSM 13165]|uniref:Signal recognition particle receptor FtsY n=1 Tax=Ignicoccus islandicus DSM 13165 TaxID=940295 RepID=A0A0U3FIC8_9CREN|nr:signal recognition particle-docking protein FtsY [Ignicoccus islandicus]ALU11654.1 signal recognition particle [Ignicoccus islandicus DSM 13165]